MSVTLHASPPAGQPAGRRRPADEAAAPSYSSQALACLAGFFVSASEAAAAVGELGASHGLLASQLTLLRPSDGLGARWTQKLRRWLRRPPGASRTWLDDFGLIALLGGIAAALVTVAWQVIYRGALDEAALVATATATLAGAAGCVVAVVLSRRRPQYRRFDRTIVNQLAAGRWAVLAHDIPVARQQDVVDAVRDRSVRWCAVYQPARWL